MKEKSLPESTVKKEERLRARQRYTKKNVRNEDHRTAGEKSWQKEDHRGTQ